MLVEMFLTSADIIPWWHWMLSLDCPNPLLASMYTPILVIPTVCIRDCCTGLLKGTKIAFMGLSAMPFPTNLLWSTTEIFFSSSSSFGPIPLSNSIWGVPMAPHDNIISLLWLFDRNAWCWFPFSSLNRTPTAFGRFPMLNILNSQVIRISSWDIYITLQPIKLVIHTWNIK